MCQGIIGKKELQHSKDPRGLIKLFSLKYVHEDDFNYNTYNYLASSQSERESADYGAKDNIDERIAKRRIDHAEEFLNETKKFL